MTLLCFRAQVLSLALLLALASTAQGQFTRQISSAGTSSFAAAPAGSDAIQIPEFRNAFGDEAGAQQPSAGIPAGMVNRSLSVGKHGTGVSVTSGKKAKSHPELNLSFDGMNFRQQRLANGGNQFSVEPPDQGLCVGNGFVMESLNDVLRVWNTNGNALVAVVDLNTFYGYPAAINRTTGVQGPFVTDPSCYFDTDTQRWFQVVLTLDVQPNGDFKGTNHIDIAVSQTANPTGAWNIYRMPVQDDGTDGTPDHHCKGGPGPGITNPFACLGDYPHIGADANGFFITTNEYEFFEPDFHAAQIYALPKAALAAGAASVSVVQFDTLGAAAGNSGFTVWPATAPGANYSTDAGGTEYFMSSNAAEEAGGNGTSDQVVAWAVTNTQSLNGSAALALSNTILNVGTYALPPLANQKAGDFPLGQCINDTTTVITSLGPPFTGCWRALFGAEPPHNEVESHIDSNDTRMQQVVYANGKLWAALDTAVTVGGANKAGLEWFILKPSAQGGAIKAKVALQGYLALENNNLTYPAIGVTPSGRGVMTFAVLGADYYPSAGYAAIDALVGTGDVHIIASGAGPDDGFTSYKAFVGNPPRTRWGDYSATATDGNTIWVASEYIAQTCTLSQYVAAPFGSCGGTRATLGNWATRISKLMP